jgi:predicted nucleic acid-binding protein
MNVVDSSAWLEYFAGSQNAENFAKVIENTDELIVPTLCLYEVFKRILQQRSEHEALQAVAAMQQAKVVDLDSRISIEAARLSVEYQLPLADSVILAATRQYQATLWTQDVHFEGMEGVQYRKPMKGK